MLPVLEGLTDKEKKEAIENYSRTVANYIKDLSFSGWDCRDQLAEVKHLLELQEGVLITDTIARETKPEEPKRRWGLF